jgi:sigma 54 modulation/S30EA-like ribosomal protein
VPAALSRPGSCHGGVSNATMWRIAINGQGVEVTNEVRQLLECELRSALEPYGGRVAFAHVRLWEPAESAGPTTCYIRVDLHPTGGLALGAVAPDLTKAVRLASERVGAAVRRQLAHRDSAQTRGSYSWFRC